MKHNEFRIFFKARETKNTISSVTKMKMLAFHYEIAGLRTFYVK